MGKGCCAGEAVCDVSEEIIMREILFRGKDESDKWAYGRLAYDVMSLGTPDAIVDKDGITIVNPDTVSIRGGSTTLRLKFLRETS